MVPGWGSWNESLGNSKGTVEPRGRIGSGRATDLRRVRFGRSTSSQVVGHVDDVQLMSTTTDYHFTFPTQAYSPVALQQQSCKVNFQCRWFCRLELRSNPLARSSCERSENFLNFGTPCCSVSQLPTQSEMSKKRRLEIKYANANLQLKVKAKNCRGRACWLIHELIDNAVLLGEHLGEPIEALSPLDHLTRWVPATSMPWLTSCRPCRYRVAHADCP